MQVTHILRGKERRLAVEHVRHIFSDQGVLEQAQLAGPREDALIVFTSDHGEGLGEHDYYFGHGKLPFNASAHVPLVIARTGGGATRRVEAPVELVDLYPTVRSLVAAEMAVPGLEGDSLLPLLGEDTDARRALSGFRLAFSQAGGGGPRTQYRSVQDRRWKLVLRPERRGDRPLPERWQLFRLDQDPTESEDLSEREPEAIERLRPVLREWMKGGAEAGREIEGWNDDALKALKALGYLD